MLALSIYINFIIQYPFVLPSSSITPFTIGAQTGSAAQKNHNEFCENDFKIIEAIQSNQMDTESVAIFIDDKFDFVYRKLEIFRFVANRKAFFVKNLMDIAKGTDNLMSKNDKMKNHKASPNSQNKEINYATTTEKALTISKTFSMAFIMSSVDDITNTFHLMIEQPSLVKIVLNYKECFHNKTMYENRIKNVSKQLWMKHRVLHIYYIPLCLIELKSSAMDINDVAVDDDDDDDYNECIVDDIYVYDAFELCPKDISDTDGGLLRKFSLRKNKESNDNNVHPVNKTSSESTNLGFQTVNDDGGDAVDDGGAKSFNDFLQIDGKRFNLHAMVMNVSFFPTTMAYLRGETKLFSKSSTKEHSLDPLSTSPDIYFGVDVEILKEFARKINFTPHVINPSDKQYYGFWNGERYTGALGDLLYQRTEFIMNAFFIKDYETRDLQFTSAVYDDEMCVVVRTADLIPEALLILKIFTEKLWIFIGVSIVAFSVIYFAFFGYLNDIQRFAGNKYRQLKEYSTAVQKLDNFINIFLNIIGIILTKPVNSFGDTNSERVLLGMCLLYALILTGAFQGCLIQVYTKPFTYPNIETLEALDKSDIWIGIQFNNNVVDLFEDRGGSPLSNMKHKLIYNANETIFQQMADYGGIALLERLLNEPSQTKKYTRSNGQSLLNFVDECPRSYTLALLVRRNCVFADVLNDYLNHIAQGGLIIKWFRDTAFTFDLEYNFHYDRIVDVEDIVLNLRHLEVSFWLLGLGFSIALLVFAFEIIVATTCNNQSKMAPADNEVRLLAFEHNQFFGVRVVYDYGCDEYSTLEESTFTCMPCFHVYCNC